MTFRDPENYLIIALNIVVYIRVTIYINGLVNSSTRVNATRYRRYITAVTAILTM